MVGIRVGLAHLQVGVEFGGVEFTVVSRQGEYLVARTLNGAGLVNGDMSCVDTHHALVGLQHRGENSRVGLCTADEECHLRVFILAGFLDFLFRAEAPLVEAVGLLFSSLVSRSRRSTAGWAPLL